MTDSPPVASDVESPVLPYPFVRKHGVLLQPAEEGGWRVMMRPGANVRALSELRRWLRQPFAVEPTSDEVFDDQLSRTYALDGSAAAAAAGTLGTPGDGDMFVGALPSADDLLDTADDAPVIRLINGMIAEAVRQGVSDVHVEPFETALVIRMRVDGLLREALRLPAHVAPVVVSRIKVMARLDIAERRIPQDGRISLVLGGKQLDVRVSTLPARAGERVVLRILDKENAAISLDELGMDAATLSVFRGALAEPNGIVLVTGPTGSGKTTSLYAGLRLLNNGARNILTVEDPVEYAIEGVGQTQVNAKVGMTFAAGLRAILRQDPDVVMIGEIRDRETADIAVQASLTGHLVLSTVHTNDAVGAITRLRDMKVEPFLLASTLRAVIAQRLVRRLCPACRVEHPATDANRQLPGLNAAHIYEPQGCAQCNDTGFKGRIGVYEAIRIDDSIRQMINDGSDEDRISRHVFAKVPTLSQSVLALVRDGVTTAEEAIRVSRQDAGSEQL